MIRILIAEDQKLVLEALSTLLSMEDDLEVVAVATDGEVAIAHALTYRPDVALIDIEMPKKSGLEVIEQLSRELPSCKTLVVTTFARKGYIERAIRFGAKGYLLKDAEISQVIEAIHHVFEGKMIVDQGLFLEAIQGKNPLSEREVELLNYLEKGMSTKHLAQQMFLAEGTIRNYLSEIMSKLDVSTRQAAIERAKQNGWL